MTTLTLHFDAPPDADGKALARELQALCAKLDDVEEAQSSVDKPRFDGALVVQDILVALQVSAGLLGAGTMTLVALKKFIDAAAAVGTKLGLSNPRLEVGMPRVPTHELNDTHVARLRRTK